MPPVSRRQQRFLASQKPALFNRWRREGKANVRQSNRNTKRS